METFVADLVGWTNKYIDLPDQEQQPPAPAIGPRVRHIANCA